MTGGVPEPLSESSYEAPRHAVEPHDHAVCVYDSPKRLEASLAHFLDGGESSGELSVFVHSFASDEEAWATLERARPGARDRAEGLLVVSLYRDAFEGGARRIDFDHVGRVVDGVLGAAASAGRNGARIFVDASRVYMDEARVDEWFAFEEWLGRRLQARVGLVCAYREADALRPDLFPRMLRTHAYRFDAPALRQ